jgi:hypothetical protein
MAPRAVLLTLFLALSACGQEAQTGLTGGDQPSSESGPVIVELRSGKEVPTALLTAGGEDQQGQIGTYCWATQCVDAAAPPTPEIYTRIAAETEIEFNGDFDDVTVSVGRPAEEPLSPPQDEQEVNVRNGRADLQLGSGRHVLVVFALWGQGDASFTFGLEVD